MVQLYRKRLGFQNTCTDDYSNDSTRFLSGSDDDGSLDIDYPSDDESDESMDEGSLDIDYPSDDESDESMEEGSIGLDCPNNKESHESMDEVSLDLDYASDEDSDKYESMVEESLIEELQAIVDNQASRHEEDTTTLSTAQSCHRTLLFNSSMLIVKLLDESVNLFKDQIHFCFVFFASNGSLKSQQIRGADIVRQYILRQKVVFTVNSNAFRLLCIFLKYDDRLPVSWNQQ